MDGWLLVKKKEEKTDRLIEWQTKEKRESERESERERMGYKTNLKKHSE